MRPVMIFTYILFFRNPFRNFRLDFSGTGCLIAEDTFLHYDAAEYDLAGMRDIHVHRTILQLIFGLGTVSFTIAVRDTVTVIELKNIRMPIDIAEQLSGHKMKIRSTAVWLGDLT